MRKFTILLILLSTIFLFSCHVPNQKLKNRMIEKYSDEFVRFINKPIVFDEYRLSELVFNLTGFGYSDTVSNITLIVNKDIKDYFYRFYIVDMTAKINVDDKDYDVNYFLSDPGRKVRLVYFYDKEVDTSTLELILKNIYKINIDDLEIDYFQSDYEKKFTIYIPTDYKFDEIFELSIYSNDFSSTLKKIINIFFSEWYWLISAQ